MDMAINSPKAIIGVVAFCFSYLFGGWSHLLIALVVFVTFDYITGLVAVGTEGKIKSQVGFWGIPKKILIFGLVAMAGMVDKVYVDLVGESINIGGYELSVMSATMVNEFISISKNLGRLGMPVPSPLKKAIEIFKDQPTKGEDK
ncbi:phage holin [Gracilibacillus halophilus YIM-C55.5]|uniref:Phage holin n=1 Tax=Gracilibacillus halophilus YIM-C55.5 TaxID=1308866 RepID=N4W9D1_9BACI|nr:phage holin family protein [Gracilibacillus halophilus]ENH96893.1 phage holin [Gracilibacillus halophilus YIM-C55.5]